MNFPRIIILGIFEKKIMLKLEHVGQFFKF